MPKVSIYKRQRIVDLSYDDDRSQCSIALEVGVSRRTVQEVLKKHRTYGGLENRPKSGRKRKLSQKDERYLTCLSKKESRATANKL